MKHRVVDKVGAYDEPYTLPWEHEYPRNDCNASGGYGAVIKGERHESSDYERGYKQGYEARKNEESKSARMIVDYDADLLKTEYERVKVGDGVKTVNLGE